MSITIQLTNYPGFCQKLAQSILELEDAQYQRELLSRVLADSARFQTNEKLKQLHLERANILAEQALTIAKEINCFKAEMEFWRTAE